MTFIRVPDDPTEGIQIPVPRTIVKTHSLTQMEEYFMPTNTFCADIKISVERPRLRSARQNRGQIGP